ncbi:MAG: hypothetical protein S4CHLAM20_14860 [Chlamydiia bacterium]|nr:hypothetical protein [Chlamydiia bacterium]
MGGEKIASVNPLGDVCTEMTVHRGSNEYMNCPHLNNAMDKVYIIVQGRIDSLRDYISSVRYIARDGLLNNTVVNLAVISDYLPDDVYQASDTKPGSRDIVESPEYIVLDRVRVTAGKTTYTLSQFLCWMIASSKEGWLESHRVLIGSRSSSV